MVLNTAGYISFSQMNSTVRFTNGNLGVNTTSPMSNLDVNGSINVLGTSSLSNVTATNISASTLIATTSVSSDIFSATNVTGTNITTGTLFATTISASNLSLSGDLNIGGILTTVNITSSNVKNTNISTATLNASGLSSLTNTTATNISTGGLIVNNITTGSINVSTLNGASNSMSCTNISVANFYSSTGTITTASILASGLSNLSVPISSSNISTGTLNISGTTILANTTATNVSVGTIVASTGITTGTIRATGISTLANTTVTNISTGGVNASGTSILANTTVTNTSTGTLNVSGLSTLLNTTATNISSAVLIASTGITSGTIRTNNLNINSTTIPFINKNSANTSNISINTNTLRLTQSGCPLAHYTTTTTASYISYQQNGGAITGLIGLDGVGYSGYAAGSFAISTWTSHPINFFINGSNKMTIASFGYIGIGTNNPAYHLDVAGRIASSGVPIPDFYNGTFSGANRAVIPIYFSDTSYNYVDIKIRFTVTSSGTNVTLSGNTSNAGNGTTLSLSEHGETTTRWGNLTTYTNSGLIATACESNNNSNFFTMRMVRSTGTSSSGNRNHYQFDTSYIYSGVGATRTYGVGWIGNTSVGGIPLGSIILTCGAGTLFGTYSTQHSY